MFYYVDETHYLNRDIAEKVSNIIYNPEFVQLRSELEALYIKLDFDKPKQQALKDALYTFFAQEECFRPSYGLR